jgi:hypothetical protein
MTRHKRMKKIELVTINPVEPGNFAGTSPEFGRWQDVQRVYSIKRGTAYNLLRDGKIKGVLLRIRGQKSGVRLFCMKSIADFICAQMKQDQLGESN